MNGAEPKLLHRRTGQDRAEPVKLDLAGKLFLPSEGLEMHCEVIALSPDTALVHAARIPAAGTPAILYIERGFGRFEGHVVEADESDTFAMEFHCTPLKREKTAELLALFVSEPLRDRGAVLRTERSSSRKSARFTRADGAVVQGEILDFSLTGVLLKCDVRPLVGEYVLIGQMAGRIARHHDNGIEITFVGKPEDCQTLERVQARMS